MWYNTQKACIQYFYFDKVILFLIHDMELAFIYFVFVRVMPKICQSASSLTTVEAGPHERPYPRCVSSLKESLCHRKGASMWGARTPSRTRARYMLARTRRQGTGSSLRVPSSFTVSWRPSKKVSHALTPNLHSRRLVTYPRNLPRAPASINLVQQASNS